MFFAIGSIIHAMICTPLDISYALSMMRFDQDGPGKVIRSEVKEHLKDIERYKIVLIHKKAQYKSVY